MKTQHFGRWHVNSWETDFSPMLFGPDDQCIEVSADGLSFDGMFRHEWVSVEAIDALRDAYAVWKAGQPIPKSNPVAS